RRRCLHQCPRRCLRPSASHRRTPATSPARKIPLRMLRSGQGSTLRSSRASWLPPVVAGSRTDGRAPRLSQPGWQEPLTGVRRPVILNAMPRPSLREQLLTAGLEVLHQKGFNATSVQDITDAAGAPKGSFYNHFESKEALALEALRLYLEKGRARRE